MTQFYIGLDLGKNVDPTALAIIERIEEPIEGEKKKTSRKYNCTHIERLPLGTDYNKVVEFVGKLMQRDELRGRCSLIIDASGVGNALMDMFADAGIPLIGINIVGGDTESRKGNVYNVSKRILIRTLSKYLYSERLTIAPHAERAALLNELQNFQETKTEAANDTYEGRSGSHDDMVLAITYALWKAEQPVIAPRYGYGF